MNYNDISIRNRHGLIVVYDSPISEPNSLMDIGTLEQLIADLQKTYSILRHNQQTQAQAIRDAARNRVYDIFRSSQFVTGDDVMPFLMDGGRRGSRKSGNCVYIMETPAMCKIGSTCHIRNRWKAISNEMRSNVTVRAIFITDGYRELETDLHELCSDYHIGGDWFKKYAMDMTIEHYRDSVEVQS